MMIRYGILFQLQVLHDFYEGATDTSVEVNPTQDTIRKMRQLSMISKMNRGKLDIGIQVSKNENGEFQSDYLKEPIELWFAVKMTDNYWSNYTDVLPKSGKGLFFTNRNGKTIDEAFLLHASDRVSEENQLEILRDSTLELSGNDEAQLVRKSVVDEEVSGVIQTVQNKKVVQTRQLEEGVYELTQSGETRTFAHVKSTTEINGVIQILINPENNDLAHIMTSNWTLESPLFQIHFSNKRSIWRYLISFDQLAHMEGLEITNGSETNLFAEPEETIAPDGGKRWMFASKEPLAITEKPTQFLQLKKNMNIENKSEGVVIDRLPVPNKENLYRVGEDGTILTDLFINL